MTTLLPHDQPAIQLALRYAKAMDSGDWQDRQRDPLAELGPKLLAALESLGMTPRARAAILGKGTPREHSGRSPLDELQERRAGRNGAKAVDAPAS